MISELYINASACDFRMLHDCSVNTAKDIGDHLLSCADDEIKAEAP